MKTNDEQESTQETSSEENMTPRGRDAFLALMKQKNPEYTPESDDQLFDDAHSAHSEIASELEKHRQANSKLSEHIAKDPRNGALFSMIANGKSTPYAVKKIWGSELSISEGEDFEEAEKGYQEHLAQLAESQKLQDKAQENFSESMERINKYCDDNQKSDEERSTIITAITDYAENLLMGIVSDSLIAEVDKGKTYDADIQEAAETGKVEGLNTKVDMTLESPSSMPDMKSTTRSDIGMQKRPRSPLQKFKEGV